MAPSATDLRLRLRAKRKALSENDSAERSRNIAARFAHWLTPRRLEIEARGGIVASYRPSEPNLEREVDPSYMRGCEELAWANFAFPRVVDRFAYEMDFAVPLHESDWVRGAYGLVEPRYELPAIDPAQLSLCIIPGVVFGLNGERIGRGAGYYDRLLAKAPGALRVGFAYEFQVLAEPVPQAAWDAPMDVIVTEERVLEFDPRGLP